MKSFLQVLFVLTVGVLLGLCLPASHGQTVNEYAWRSAADKWEYTASLWEASALRCQGVKSLPEVCPTRKCLTAWRRWNNDALTSVLSSQAMKRASLQIDRNSDAYKLGWIEGRSESFYENVGIEGFHICINNKPSKSPQECWDEQIKLTTQQLSEWDKLSDQQKIEYGERPEIRRWINNLRGRGDRTDLPRYLR
jgi:hypothetical protein